MLLVLGVALLPAAARAQATDEERVVWRALVGEAALELRAGGGVVRLGAAGDSATVSVTLRATDTRRFATELQRRLASGRARDTAWTLRVEEPGVSAGALSVSASARRADRTREFALFVTDEALTSVRQVLTAPEAAMLARRLRAAAVAATPPRATRRRPNAKAVPPAGG